uniref:Ig-like domain-containing protein n=1 Tax=Neogobius melanostomus TaxID=47308 RepID=A0A8C6S4X3_9GOBI
IPCSGVESTDTCGVKFKWWLYQFHFVTFLYTGVSSSLTVTQSEDVTVTEGDTASISCCWEHVEHHVRTRVTWMKNKRDIVNYLLDATSKCSFLTIATITMEHSGTYICTVEVPVFKQASGNGTIIRVLAKEKTEETKENGTYFFLCTGSPTFEMQ